MIVQEEFRQQICSFMDYVWNETQQSSKGCVDMRLVVPNHCFIRLLGASTVKDVGCDQKCHQFLNELQSLHGTARPNIVLRMTRGPTESCIHFHCDNPGSTCTLQMALNDPSEHIGGRLCFYVDNKMHILERPIASVVKHGNNFLHGVTNLVSGTRKSLFVLDESARLEKEGAIMISLSQLNRFIRTTAAASENVNQTQCVDAA